MKHVPAADGRGGLSITLHDRRRSPLESRWIPLQRSPVHYLASEAAPEDRMPVVLVHGMVVASGYMIPLGSLMAPHHRVYAPDLPGYGLSPDPARILRLPELADALDAWMEAVGLEQTALLGNSFGCQIIVELALRHPERVERAILQGPTRDPHHPRALQQLKRWNENRKLEPKSLGPIVRDDYFRAGPRRAYATFWEMVRDPIEKKLPRVRAPTLVIGGTCDHITPTDWVKEAARILPNGRAEIVEGGTHTANYSHAEQVADIVLPWLSEPAG